MKAAEISLGAAIHGRFALNTIVFMTFDPGTIGILLAILPVALFTALGNETCPNTTCIVNRRPKEEIPTALVRVVNVVRKSDGTTQQDKGSGVMIAYGRERLILTAAHIFREGTGRISIMTLDGRWHVGNLSAKNVLWDVAFVRTEPPLDIHALTFAEEAATVNEETVAWGFGPDGSVFGRRGRVVGYVRSGKTDSNETLKTTGRAREGDSGGPVLNDRGELIGLLWGTDGTYTYSTWSGRLRAMIEENLTNENIALLPEKEFEQNGIAAENNVESAVSPPSPDVDLRSFGSLKLLEAAATALGFGTPTALFAYGLARLLMKRKKANSPSTRSETLSLNDAYAEQLNALYGLSGHSTTADATLGRLYDTKLRDAEQSIDGETAKVAKLLRKQVADQFLRIHSTNPAPVES